MLYHEACGILVPWPRIKPVPLQWKLGVLSTGHQGHPDVDFFICLPIEIKHVYSFNPLHPPLPSSQTTIRSYLPCVFCVCAFTPCPLPGIQPSTLSSRSPPFAQVGEFLPSLDPVISPMLVLCHLFFSVSWCDYTDVGTSRPLECQHLQGWEPWSLRPAERPALDLHFFSAH